MPAARTLTSTGGGLKQYEGKQVRVKGTLDADGKAIP
jgi:hypothetical protein